MRTFIKRALLGALIGGGIAVLGAGVANAAETSGDDGPLQGTHVVIDIDAPVTIEGNAVSVIGDSRAEGSTPPAPAQREQTPAGVGAPTTPADGGTASGGQVAASIATPVTIRGNAVALAGDSRVANAPAAPEAPEAPAQSESSKERDMTGVLSGAFDAQSDGSAVRDTTSTVDDTLLTAPHGLAATGGGGVVAHLAAVALIALATGGGLWLASGIARRRPIA